ncbi:hypothetical protein RIF29_04467 [Crotalaria pallida]|uniref:Glabrous enhancer-binding protein-like DBD domain-containing protein n=1 Tax=Crotalaria pallida TaxID=3830 RepID=A0AAN9PAD7_CROPI
MDSTPFQTPSLVPLPSNSNSNSKSKLPIKRKTLHSSHNHPTLSPNPNPNPNLNNNFPSPFKFHRIWTQPDEIRFLQALLDSASDGLVFPKDLNIFYHRFSSSAATCHPYTKSQLSEKLRRLRNKFRALSSRIHDVAAAALSPHNRALFELSRKLWSPEFASASPFVVANSSLGKGIGSNSKIKVEEEEEEGDLIPVNCANPDRIERRDDDNDDRKEDDEMMGIGFGGGKIDGVVSKSVLDVFDECVKEAKKKSVLWHGVLCGDQNFGKRWREQRALELDVVVKRLRLVIEDSFNKQNSANV